MIKSKIWIFWSVGPLAALAQQLPGQTAGSPAVILPNLWLALFSGLVLTASFQLLLSLATMATGLRGERYKPATDTAANRQPLVTGWGGRRFGWWILATTSFSLFSASALAVNLSAVTGAATGAMLGLVIWGLFFLGMTYLESRAAGRAAGFLFRIGIGSFREAAKMTRRLAGTQPETERLIAKIRSAVARDVFGPGVADQLRTYLETLRTSYNEPVVMTRDQAQSYARKLETAAAVATSELTHEMASTGPGGPRQFFEANYEGAAEAKPKPRLNYSAIRNDLMKVLYDPKAGADVLLRRLREVDGNALRSVLMEREDLSDQEMETLLSHIESARDDLIAKAQRMAQEIDRRVGELRTQSMQRASDARKKVSHAATWGVAVATVSGAAAILGGIVGAG